MYCRKCGAKMSNTARFCDSCGEEVKKVRQRSDTQKYEERKIEDAKQSKSKKFKHEKVLEELKNPYAIPILGTVILAFGLAIFPWPISWRTGTSLWMRILILCAALLSDYHCTKSRQVNNLYSIQYHYRVQPRTITVATVLVTFIIVVLLFALINM